MSHELTQRADGFIEFAYLASDGAAWHGLGQPVEDGQSIEVWQKAAGMDWSIQRSIVRYLTERDGAPVELPGHHVLMRSDTKAPLGVVSKAYKTVQPAQVLEFFRATADLEGLALSAAGTIFDGKRFWATAKIGDASPVSSDDKIGGYLLLSTSSDGSLATEARFTSVRVVCRNTLQMARAAAANVRLTHRSVFAPDEIHARLGTLKLRETWAEFQRAMACLADVPLTTDGSQEFVLRLLSGGAQQVVELEGDRADKIRESVGYQSILGLFEGGARGSHLTGATGTAYAMINAVTEYTDHHVRARSGDNRFASAQWGPAAELKERAFEMLLAQSNYAAA